MEGQDSDGQHDCTPIGDSLAYEWSGVESIEYMYIPCQPQGVVESINNSSEDEQIYDEICTNFTTEIAATLHSQIHWSASSPDMSSNTLSHATDPLNRVGSLVAAVEGVGVDKFRKQSSAQQDYVHITVSDNLVYGVSRNESEKAPEKPLQNISLSVEPSKAPSNAAVAIDGVQVSVVTAKVVVDDMLNKQSLACQQDNVVQAMNLDADEEYEYMTSQPQRMSMGDQYKCMTGCPQYVVESTNKNCEEEETYHEIASLSPVPAAGVVAMVTILPEVKTQQQQCPSVQSTKSHMCGAAPIDGDWMQSPSVTVKRVEGDMLNKHQDNALEGTNLDEYEYMTSQPQNTRMSDQYGCAQNVVWSTNKSWEDEKIYNEIASLSPVPVAGVVAMLPQVETLQQCPLLEPSKSHINLVVAFDGVQSPIGEMFSRQPAAGQEDNVVQGTNGSVDDEYEYMTSYLQGMMVNADGNCENDEIYLTISDNLSITPELATDIATMVTITQPQLHQEQPRQLFQNSASSIEPYESLRGTFVPSNVQSSVVVAGGKFMAQHGDQSIVVKEANKDMTSHPESVLESSNRRREVEQLYVNTIMCLAPNPTIGVTEMVIMTPQQQMEQPLESILNVSPPAETSTVPRDAAPNEVWLAVEGVGRENIRKQSIQQDYVYVLFKDGLVIKSSGKEDTGTEYLTGCPSSKVKGGNERSVTPSDIHRDATIPTNLQ